MVVIAIALQHRLLDAAARHLGPGGDALLRTTAQSSLATPFEQLTYAQLPQLLDTVERTAPQVGEESALALAEALRRLAGTVDAGLGRRLIDAAAGCLGPAAEPFLANLCRRQGLTLAGIGRAQVPQLALAARHEGGGLLGPETAAELAAALEQAGLALPTGLAQQVTDAAAAHAGPEGERILRQLCHERLEVDLDDLNLDGIALLAQTVEREGAGRIGTARIAAFMAAARACTVSPAGALRSRIVELVNRRVGPAGPMFVKRLCTRHGLPFEAVSYEHVMWLAEVLRAEAMPLLGKEGAVELALSVQNLLADER